MERETERQSPEVKLIVEPEAGAVPVVQAIKAAKEKAAA